MFSKKKKKPEISRPTNFEHRVHTGFDKREGRYVGLPLQWASIVGNNQILKSTNRPLPLVDPSEITLTEILDLKTIVRPHFNKPNSHIDDTVSIKSTHSNNTQQPANAIVLPKTSHVARSNSLRSSSPPRIRRDLRAGSNVPPSVPEEPAQVQQMNTINNNPLGSANIPLQQMNQYVTKPPHQMHMHQQSQQQQSQQQQYSNGMNPNAKNSNEMPNAMAAQTEHASAMPYR